MPEIAHDTSNATAPVTLTAPASPPVAPEHGTPKLLDQFEASALLLRECGIRRKPRTLQKARCTGIGSPPFVKVIGRVYYERDELLAWGRALCSARVRSTSELPKQAA